MIKQHVDGVWVAFDGDMVVGQRYRKYNSAGGYAEFTYSVVDSSTVELEWVNGELSRTDLLMLLPDYPYTEEISEYRRQLREYDLTGDRPVTPSTESGHSL